MKTWNSIKRRALVFRIIGTLSAKCEGGTSRVCCGCGFCWVIEDEFGLASKINSLNRPLWLAQTIHFFIVATHFNIWYDNWYRYSVSWNQVHSNTRLFCIRGNPPFRCFKYRQGKANFIVTPRMIEWQRTGKWQRFAIKVQRGLGTLCEGGWKELETDPLTLTHPQKNHSSQFLRPCFDVLGSDGFQMSCWVALYTFAALMPLLL